MNDDTKAISIERTADGRLIRTAEMIPRAKLALVDPGLISIPQGYRHDDSTREAIIATNEQVVDLARQIETGIEPEPVTLFFNGMRKYYLAEGYISFRAHQRLMRPVPAQIYDGDESDALLFANSNKRNAHNYGGK